MSEDIMDQLFIWSGKEIYMINEGSGQKNAVQNS